MRGPANTDAIQRNSDAAGFIGAAVEIAASADEYWVVDEIGYSFDAEPTLGPSLSVTYGTYGISYVVVFNLDLGVTHKGRIRSPRGLTLVDSNGQTGVLNQQVAVGIGVPGFDTLTRLNVSYR